MLIFFFVKYTATNEIYTYVPTLSLHAARPILVGRRIADNGWTLYCSRDYADLHGIPHSREELAAHPFIGGGGHVWEPYRAWLRQYALEDAVVMQYDTASGPIGRASCRERRWQHVEIAGVRGT